MDRKLFEQRLSELAEFKRGHSQLTKPVAKTNKKKIELDEFGEPIDLEEDLALDTTSTQPLVITELKPTIKLCDDCDRVVDNPRRTSRIVYFPVKHWRTYCHNCQLTKNPNTGAFDLDKRTEQSVFYTYLRDKITNKE